MASDPQSQFHAADRKPGALRLRPDSRDCDLNALLADPRRVAELPPEAIPGLLGELERLRVALWARLMSPTITRDGLGGSAVVADQWLTVEEATAILNVTPRWLYRHAKRLPFTRRLSPKALRFSEAGLKKWVAAKKT